jgi:hypothetical protein
MPLSGSHSHTATVTVDQTTPAASLDDFTMYIDLADMPAAFWDSVANGGGDIRTFLADGTELAREVVPCSLGASYLTFNGTTDYVAVTPPSVLTSEGDWELVIFLRGQAQIDKRVFSIGSGVNSTFWALGSGVTNSSKLRIYNTLGGDIEQETSADVFDGNTHVIRVVFDSTANTINLFVDGDTTADISMSFTGSFNQGYLSFGAITRQTGTSPAAYFAGDIFSVEFIGENKWDARNISGTTWTDSADSNNGTLTGGLTDTDVTESKTGELHVKVPTLSVIQDTVLHLYTDGASADYAATDTFGRNAVWSDYRGVYHLENRVFVDSSGSHGNAVATGTTTTEFSHIGNGVNFSEGELTTLAEQFAGPDLTVSAWVKPDKTSGDEGTVVGSWDTTPNILFRVEPASGGSLEFFLNDGSTKGGGFTDLAIGTTSYKHIVGRLDSGTMSGFVDGTKSATEYTGVGTLSSSTRNIVIGNTDHNLDDWFDGLIDEVRFSDVALSANWITTEYNNQSDPSSFYTATDPNAGGGATVDTASLLAQAAAVTGTFTIEGAAGAVTVTFADLQAQSATTPASTATREITSSAALSATDIEFLNYAAREVTSASTLAAQSAAVSGSSDPMRTSEGVLTAQEADLAGTASRTVVAVGSVQAQDSGVASTVGQNQNVTGTGVLTTFPVSLMATVAINGEVPVTGSLATVQIATSRQH